MHSTVIAEKRTAEELALHFQTLLKRSRTVEYRKFAYHDAEPRLRQKQWRRFRSRLLRADKE